MTGFEPAIFFPYHARVHFDMPGSWNSAFVARSGSPAAIRVTSLLRQAFHRLLGSPPGPHDDMPCGVWNFPSRDPPIFDNRS